jgi:alkylation response protein AidB-like acyl-CoA dehydrogenase
MPLALDEQQIQLSGTLASFLREKLPSPWLHQVFDGDDDFDQPLWDGLSGLGVAGLLAPEASGGTGLTLFEAALVSEAMGYAGAPVPFLSHSLTVMALAMAGGDAAARWLPALADGSVLGTVAFHDSAGWRPEDWTKTEDPGWQREWRFVPAAGASPLIIVGLSGGRLGLVAPAAEGVSLTPMSGIDRTRRLTSLTLESTPIEVLPLTSAQVTQVADAALVLLAADAFGGAQRVLDMSVGYARERVQYGRPIAGFQAVRHQLANMASEVEPCRALWWHAALAVSAGLHEASSAAALTKAHCAERFLQAARDGVELHAGIGFTWEHDMHIWLKRALYDVAWAGDATVHRLRHADLSGW